MNTTIVLAFVTMIVLMALVYYVGLKSDVGAVSSAVNSFGQTFTGRTASGAFAGYPT